MKQHQKRKYDWVDRTFRCKVRKYFKDMEIPGLSEDLYDKHEGEFLYLMDSKYGKESRVSFKVHIQEFENLSAFYEKSFTHPTQRNLFKFFSLPAIQLLWQNVFLKSAEFKLWLKQTK